MGSELGSRGKGLFGRLPAHSFPISWTPGQAEGRQKGKADGWGQANFLQTSLEAVGSPQQIQRLTDTQECGVTPHNSP